MFRTPGYMKDEYNITITQNDLFDILLSLDYDLQTDRIKETPARELRLKNLANRLHSELDLGHGNHY